MTNRLSERKIKGFKLALVVIIWLFAFVQIAITLIAIRTTKLRNDGVVVVSSRSKVEDVEFISASISSHKVLFLNAESEFGKHVMSSLGRTESNINFYEALDHKPNKRLSPIEGVSQVREIIDSAARATSLPFIPIIVAFSIGVGLIFSVPRTVTASLMAGGSVLAIMKSVDACPTCPKVTILGVDAGLMGFSWLLMLATVAIFLRNPKISGPILLVGCFLVNFWQLVAIQSNQMQCSYCTIIALMIAFGLSSLDVSPTSSPTQTKQLWSLLPLGISTFSAGFLHFSKGEYRNQEPRALTALGRPKKTKIYNIAELGIKPKKERRILYVAAAGCSACENGLHTVLALAGDSIELWYVGKTPPTTGRNWHKIEVDAKVTDTPTTLFVDENGDVKDLINGYSSDNLWIKNLDHKVEQFLLKSKRRESK